MQQTFWKKVKRLRPFDLFTLLKGKKVQKGHKKLHRLLMFEIYRMSKMLSVTPNTCSLPTSHLSQPSPTHRIILCHFLPSGPEYRLFRLFCIFRSTRTRASKKKVVKENDTSKTKMLMAIVGSKQESSDQGEQVTCTR